MNKATKGAIAAGAAALLLAGGAGTMASWTASSSMTGGTITAGHLTLTADPTALPSWSVTNGSVTTPNVDIATYLVVPGDVVTYSGTVKIGAKGNNLKANLTADLGTVSGDPALLAEMAATTTATANGVALPSGPGGVAITTANDGQTVAVNVVFDFVKGTATTPATNASQDDTITLTNFNIKLDQV